MLNHQPRRCFNGRTAGAGSAARFELIMLDGAVLILLNPTHNKLNIMNIIKNFMILGLAVLLASCASIDEPACLTRGRRKKTGPQEPAGVRSGATEAAPPI